MITAVAKTTMTPVKIRNLDMTAEIHDMVAAGDKVAIRATYRGTDEGGFIP